MKSSNRNNRNDGQQKINNEGLVSTSTSAPQYLNGPYVGSFFNDLMQQSVDAHNSLYSN